MYSFLSSAVRSGTASDSGLSRFCCALCAYSNRSWRSYCLDCLYSSLRCSYAFSASSSLFFFSRAFSSFTFCFASSFFAIRYSFSALSLSASGFSMMPCLSSPSVSYYSGFVYSYIGVGVGWSRCAVGCLFSDFLGRPCCPLSC